MKFILKAILNKKSELFISLAMVLVLLLLASVSMYALEHRAQPDAFSSVAATMWWGVATLTTVGYGDIYPITTAGKILGGFIAILGVGLFALPAGIIASGFVEEMEEAKKRQQLKRQAQQLKEAFEIEYFGPVIKIKKQLGLENFPRKWLSLHDIKYKLAITETALLDITASSNQFRIRSVKLNGVNSVGLEYTPSNRLYGQCIDRASSLTIINMYANIQAFFGHFSQAVAYRLEANFVSNETYNKVNFNRNKRLNLIHNESYVTPQNQHPALQELKKDLLQLAEKKSICIMMVSAATNENLLQFNVGGTKGSHHFEDAVFFKDLILLEKAFETAENIAQKQQMKILKHQNNGAPNKDHISWYLHQKSQCQLILLHVNVGILKNKASEYYRYIDQISSILSVLKTPA